MAHKRVKAIDFQAGKPTRWQAFDVYAFEVAKDESQRRMTPEGFMVVPANISRADNVQEYSALELGLEGTNRTIRIFRPKAEVFKPESYSTFERQTLTNNHPEGDVTAGNYRSVTAGDVHDVAPADETNLGANLYFKAQDAIEMVVEYGKNQLSCGYSFVLDMTPGTSPDGQAYDGVMREIVGNHVALVWQARGGPGLRVADNDPTSTRRDTMRIRVLDTVIGTHTIPGFSFTVADEAAGTVAQDAVDRHNKAIVDCMAAHDAVKKQRDDLQNQLTQSQATSEAAATDAKKKAGDAALEIEKLKAQILTPEQEAARIDERIKLVGDAKSIVGDEFDAKGKTDAQIRVAALDHILATDGPAKNIATAVLGGTEPSKANEKDAKTALDAVIGLGAAISSATGSAGAFVPVKKIGDATGGSGNARVVKYGNTRPGAAKSQTTGQA